MSGFDNAKLDEEFFAAGNSNPPSRATATLRSSRHGALGSALARHVPCCNCRLLANNAAPDQQAVANESEYSHNDSVKHTGS